MAEIMVGRHPIHFSNADKVLFPRDGITKADLVDYYEQVADTMVPHLRGRPLMMARYPHGVEENSLCENDVPRFPDWIHRVEVAREGWTVTHVVCDDAASLVFLAGQACITAEVWLSRTDRIDNPDRLVFDLDPSGDDFSPVRAAAQMLAGALEGLGLPSYVQLTGSRGLHVVVPLDRRADFDTVRGFARDVASLLATHDQERLTTEQRQDKRGGSVLIDIRRNAYAQTAVAPYAVRALPGAPIATPLDWDELEDHELGSQHFSMRTVLERLESRDDPWGDIGRHAHSLTEPRRRLDRLVA
jgi:bifunctional non-homologous end joining protein LigD